MDLLRVLSSPDLEVRKKTLSLILDLINSRNVEEVGRECVCVCLCVCVGGEGYICVGVGCGWGVGGVWVGCGWGVGGVWVGRGWGVGGVWVGCGWGVVQLQADYYFELLVDAIHKIT